MIIFNKKDKVGIEMATVYLDTCIVIGLIEGVFVRLEARLLAVRKNKLIQLQVYDSFFSVCEFVELNRSVFDLATILRAENNLKTPDAIHLAAAIKSNCDELCTNDKHLIKISTQHIKVIDWEIMLRV